MTKNEKKKLQNNHAKVNKYKKETKEQLPPSSLKITGLQTIVCSATLQMDGQGRLRPTKGNKKSKRGEFDAIAELFKKIRFTSKAPKNINLTSEMKMPEQLEELYHRCQVEDKDVYLYYFL